eukprot:Plantae.Rhodophyta-Purpureofilum_apyrenoidigerum.ctg20804.p1 GENE.Plantae.Rhodophyta-Purpureofilum_apyrenoidigerum.ctg20804~~Plantae.Rhodophyta-Purpureofilum_apyrenoidigerum.ctg20804.p1  ORF type:complete len:396 (-),score=49.47 Plantae.Rhodophyta-Purpureofilum_apyrenoidigerum.ctg20804:167-1354(-)
MNWGFVVRYAALWVASLTFFFSDSSFPRSVGEAVRLLPVPSQNAISIVCGFVLVLAVLSRVLPGKVIMGTKLSNGSQLAYKTNGLLLTLVMAAAFCISAWLGWIDGSYLADHYFQLWGASFLFSIVLSVYLFIVGKTAEPEEELRGPMSLVHDFVLGTELNPHILDVDVKFFSYRPAMCGWLLINLSFIFKHYALFGHIATRMLVYTLLSSYYIVDYFYFEPNMVTTWDIIAEKFGFMLVWGDYFFIPMTFSLQNLFLYDTTMEISFAMLVVIFSIFLAGLIIFREANSQKHQFKQDPSKLIWGRTPETVSNRLLVSGFWGLARHINYLGDLLLALSFCLPCGMRSPKAYFYFIYLLLLLVHREQRDEAKCYGKYGEIWQTYCSRVPYRIIPGIY